MNTKEAIESLMNLEDNELNPFHVRAWYEERDEIIKLIKELEKYKKMWEEFQLMYGYRTTYDELGEDKLSSIDNILNNVKKRYFPEPEHEQVLILSVKGENLVVNEIVECIKRDYSNSKYVNVKEGSRGFNVQER